MSVSTSRPRVDTESVIAHLTLTTTTTMSAHQHRHSLIVHRDRLHMAYLSPRMRSSDYLHVIQERLVLARRRNIGRDRGVDECAMDVRWMCDEISVP